MGSPQFHSMQYIVTRLFLFQKLIDLIINLSNITETPTNTCEKSLPKKNTQNPISVNFFFKFQYSYLSNYPEKISLIQSS